MDAITNTGLDLLRIVGAALGYALTWGFGLVLVAVVVIGFCSDAKADWAAARERRLDRKAAREIAARDAARELARRG